jgi:type II secretory pathway pseudopilin PulG
MSLHKKRTTAFTLIELLVVIAIIIILVGLLYPAYQAVQNQAKRTQAKNDLTQIVTAVNAFYTEYGRYPTSLTPDTTATYGPAGPNTNDVLFNELRACHLQGGVLTDPSCSAASVLNTRQIVFISPPSVKDPANPRAGIGIPGTGAPAPVGQYWDPWGTPYNVRIDGDYDNATTNPYGAQATGGAGVDPITQGVIGWSYGAERQQGTNGDNVYKNPTTGAQSDDVISWQ